MKPSRNILIAVLDEADEDNQVIAAAGTQAQDTADDQIQACSLLRVMAAGPGTINADGSLIETCAKVSDRILVRKLSLAQSGLALGLNGKQVYLFPDNLVLGVLEEEDRFCNPHSRVLSS